jgi:hypothetical protein
MGLVSDLYSNDPSITDDELIEEILKHKSLDVIDLWLLPQYPFDEWRKKFDYPKIIESIKSNQQGFNEWMSEYHFIDEELMDAKISSCVAYKNMEGAIDNKFHLIKVTYKGRASLQVWYSYNNETEHDGAEGKVIYEYIRSFVSYSDWCVIKNYRNNLFSNLSKHEQNTIEEEVYLNGNTKLLKMGGISPPKNALGILLRGKELEFINVSGLQLSDTIHYSDYGNLEFHFCTVDNLKCNELDILFLIFSNCSVNNIQITNSLLNNWKFSNSIVTGFITNSKLRNWRIWGGQFIPIFINSEPYNFGVSHEYMNYENDFDRTYRALHKANNDIGNYSVASKFKILELDFKRASKTGFNKFLWSLDKYYWEYGQNPKRILRFTVFTILSFGIIYAFAPSLILKNPDKISFLERMGNSLYCSISTFVTLGYSDVSPKGIMKIFASIEAIIGAISMGFLVVSLTRTKN